MNLARALVCCGSLVLSVIVIVAAVVAIVRSNGRSGSATGGQPAGWYPDPMGRNEFRYWDGAAWTAAVSNGGVQSTDPV